MDSKGNLKEEEEGTSDRDSSPLDPGRISEGDAATSQHYYKIDNKMNIKVEPNVSETGLPSERECCSKKHVTNENGTTTDCFETHQKINIKDEFQILDTGAAERGNCFEIDTKIVKEEVDTLNRNLQNKRESFSTDFGNYDAVTYGAVFEIDNNTESKHHTFSSRVGFQNEGKCFSVELIKQEFDIYKESNDVDVERKSAETGCLSEEALPDILQWKEDLDIKEEDLELAESSRECVTKMWPARRLVKYGIFAGATIGTVVSLKANQYNIDSIGVVRLGRAAFTVFNIAVCYKQQLYGSKLDHSTTEYQQLKSRVHKQAAEKLLELCCQNRGVYIKVGQHIGALDYLVPPEYVDTMKILHSHAPCSTIEEIYRVLREDLKQDPKEIFVEMEMEPLGAASLAQVHKATLKDGTVVAVKVQHPYVRGNSLVDMKTMEVLVKLVSWAFPDFQFQWLVDETKRNIPKELNFLEEGRNAEKVATMFKHFSWLKVPQIYWNLSTERVLTMEFVEGGQVNDLNYITSNGINPYEVSDKLSQLYSQMIFIKGFVHSDPHPGNILLKKNPHKNEVDVILLDHGLYAELSNEFRWEYAKLWFSILNKDKVGMREHSRNLGVDNLYFLLACMITGRTWDAIMAGIEKTKFTTSEKEIRDREIPNLLPHIASILQTINRQMLLIFKTNDLMRGIEYTLKCQYRKTSFLVMSRCVIQSVYSERRRQCKSLVSLYWTVMKERWELFKLSLYYTYLTVLSHPAVMAVRSLVVTIPETPPPATI